MTIQPTLSFSFVPTCNTFSCCGCLSSSEEGDYAYPMKNGKFRSCMRMTDKEVAIANKRFKEMIIRKLQPLALDVDEFMRRLEEEEGIDFSVSECNPLTKKRVHDTIKKINKVLDQMHIY